MLGSDNKLYVPATALATTTKVGSINKLTGNTTDFLDGTNAFQPLANAVQPTIWSARLRSFNALNNNAFEVDQRTAGAGVTVPTGTVNSMPLDRWNIGKIGTMAGTGQQLAISPPDGVIPGTNFCISRSLLRIKVTTAQASLGAGDYWQLQQVVEGPSWRELQNDVHSISLLVRSTVANLKFGVALRDNTGSRSLTKLCALGTANTWTLITLPNLPLWPAAGTFTTAPGSFAYYLHITLAAGATWTAAANDTWQSTGVLAALGQDNFFSNAVNSQFDIAYISHEPGSQCSNPPLDLPYQQAYDNALRYFQKTYDLGTVAGTATVVGVTTFVAPSAVANAYGPLRFHKPLAKIPTVTLYNYSTGAANSVVDQAAVNHAGAAAGGIGISGFYGISFTTAVTSAMPVYAHYTADTGW
jgi:hypothetical protein